MRDCHDDKKIYVHYGSKHFDIKVFKEARNEILSDKPAFGLWGSPVNSDYGWKKWCHDNEFMEYDEDNCFFFRIDSGAKVYEIKTVHDIEALPMVPIPRRIKEMGFKWLKYKYFIDFEQLMEKDISAIEIYFDGVKEVLSDYDCDSVIILKACGLIEIFDAQSNGNPL